MHNGPRKKDPIHLEYQHTLEPQARTYQQPDQLDQKKRENGSWRCGENGLEKSLGEMETNVTEEQESVWGARKSGKGVARDDAQATKTRLNRAMWFMHAAAHLYARLCGHTLCRRQRKNAKPK